MIQRRKKEERTWKKAPYRPPEPIEVRAPKVEPINPRLDDLRLMVRQFICMFPYPTHLDIKVNTWSAGLKDFPAESIKRVFKFYLGQSGIECPAMADILHDLQELELCHEDYAKRFTLPPHQCHPTENTASHALSVLAAVDPYAAAHVACDCPGTPVCPECGSRVEASVNPVVFHLMERHPQDTVDWKPERKGYYLCQKCRAAKN